MKRFSLRMPEQMHERLRWESFKTGISINDLILNELKEKYKEGTEMKKDNLVVFETVKIEGKTIAILLDNENMEAYEAVWDENQNDWETDFDYTSLDLDSFDVAGSLDFQKVEKMGYTFVE